MWDCGMIEKVRPVLSLSIPFADAGGAVVTVVLHSTALRGSPFEAPLQLPFLQEGAFIAQSRLTPCAEKPMVPRLCQAQLRT